MKITFCFLLTFILITMASFCPPAAPASKMEVYVFVTDTEHDTALDDGADKGYVDITTNIVVVNCRVRRLAIERQYIQQYNAGEATATRSRAHIGTTGVTTAWIYHDYDRAVDARRRWLENGSTKHRRTIDNLQISCN